MSLVPMDRIYLSHHRFYYAQLIAFVLARGGEEFLCRICVQIGQEIWTLPEET